MPAGSRKTNRVNAAVVCGHHAFDVPAFYGLLRSMPDIDFYPQHMANYLADFGKARAWYDVVAFYNYHQDTAGDGKPSAMREVLGELGQSPQGVVLWHHGLVAFPRWRRWSELSGLEDRSFAAHKEQAIRVLVQGPEHSITRGLDDWEVVDETYAMESTPLDSDVILATEHPRSMKAIAWTREYGQARVFCYQSGHDRQSYTDPSFRCVLDRGIQWAARHLEQ